MLKTLQSFIQSNKLGSSKPVLIGVSGGIDSVVLCDLYHHLHIPFAIGHCNFSLRDQESDEDEFFVLELSKVYKVPFHSITFNTKEYAQKQGISIQMAARELRMKWFEKLSESFNYEFYATAHHQDDAIETYLINQIRGTGISGLHGILPKQGKLIHPLLFTFRDDIANYAESHSLKWREDSSNTQTKYLRNQVRLEIIPMLLKLNPNIKKVLFDNMERISASEQIYTAKIEECKTEMTSVKKGDLVIDLEQLLAFDQSPTLLYEFIRVYGFNYDQCKQILEIDLKSTSGASMRSASHQLLRDRDSLILKKTEPKDHDQYSILEGTDKIDDPLKMTFELTNSSKIIKEDYIAQFDYRLIKFPLYLRKWEKGDYFYPLGMQGQKKLLSDYFIDQKLSLFEKENIWLLCSGQDIIWIIGHRMDNRFKIKKETKETFQITLINTDC